MDPSGSKWRVPLQVALSGSKWHAPLQVAPSGSMWLQVVHAASSGSKWLQVACAASSGSKWLQVARSVSSGSKWLQMAPSGSCPSGTRLSMCSKYPTALQVDPSRHDVKGPLPNRVLPQRPQLQSRFGRRPKVSDSVFLRVGVPTFTGHSRSNGTVSRGNGVASRFVTLQFLNGRCCTSGLVMITQPYQTPTNTLHEQQVQL